MSAGLPNQYMEVAEIVVEARKQTIAGAQMAGWTHRSPLAIPAATELNDDRHHLLDPDSLPGLGRDRSLAGEWWVSIRK